MALPTKGKIKAISTTEEKRDRETTDHATQKKIANRSNSLNSIFHNIDTSQSHDSDDNANNTKDKCENTSSSQYFQQWYLWTRFTSKWIGDTNDYISITDNFCSISSLTMETAPATVFVHELLQMKNSLQTARSQAGKAALPVFHDKWNVPVDYQQKWSLEKYKSIG